MYFVFSIFKMPWGRGGGGGGGGGRGGGGDHMFL